MSDTFILVDLFNGKYNEEHIGFELYNDQKNSATGKYYGYIPPRDNPVITKLGASSNDDYVDDILVVFVKKLPPDFGNSGERDGKLKPTDRMVIGFYPSARIYRKKRSGEQLSRTFTDKDGSQKTATYSIESDVFYRVPSEHALIIETGKYDPYLFRGQRVYSGKHPALDGMILDYIERLMSGTEEEDGIITQRELQEIPEASDDMIRKAPLRQPAYEQLSSGKRVQRNPQLTKSAVIAADYQCEVNAEHETFRNRHNKPYMEGHHLIPCTTRNAETIWQQFGKNIDCQENIVSLCPTCHRAIHMGNQDEKKRVLSMLVPKRLPLLRKIGIKITAEKLFQLYGVK